MILVWSYICVIFDVIISAFIRMIFYKVYISIAMYIFILEIWKALTFVLYDCQYIGLYNVLHPLLLLKLSVNSILWTVTE